MKILINDFIGGYLQRGIPQYVGNLALGLSDVGHRVTRLRAPRWFERLPRAVAHAISVAVEQLAVPVYGRLIGADVVLYPYNSASLLDLRSGRGRIVVHDLEVLAKPAGSLSRRYAEWCFRAVQRRGHPVFTVSPSARDALSGCPFFERSAIHVLPNVFFAFERTLESVGAVPVDGRSVLLCTGHTPNKELPLVASRFLPALLARGLTVRVVGLHTEKGREALRPLLGTPGPGRLIIHDREPDHELARLYAQSAFVWVHSRSEGFGRPVVEARLAGRPVVCSEIPPFRALADGLVRHYSDPDSFVDGVDWALAVGEGASPYTGFDYRASFHAVLGQLLCAA